MILASSEPVVGRRDISSSGTHPVDVPSDSSSSISGLRARERNTPSSFEVRANPASAGCDIRVQNTLREARCYCHEFAVVSDSHTGIAATPCYVLTSRPASLSSSASRLRTSDRADVVAHEHLVLPQQRVLRPSLWPRMQSCFISRSLGDGGPNCAPLQTNSNAQQSILTLLLSRTSR
ncbi:hypothetical protein L226DRAFT_39348 [Lentinus tigrinus ALCF2SS1-7]|uniref:uncharacterized protein n=1 Tax=Lentinus tigrinus ALCF2SS1-7 TaxID=1328758 RepID=UPI001165EA22|nr:hypothetical protein L226DRAFT_39348 [Lentinus tigrinus ALCF2SS1-7]